MTKASEACYMAVELARRTESLHLQSRALAQLATLKIDQGQYQEAIIVSRQAHLIAQNSGNLYDQARALAREASGLIHIGRDYSKASKVIVEALLLHKILGMDSRSGLHIDLLNLQAEMLMQKTEYADSRKVNQAICGDIKLATFKTHLDNSESPSNLPIFETVLALLNIVYIDIATCGSGNHSEDEIQSNLKLIRDILTHCTSFYVLLCDITLGNLYLHQQQHDVAQRIFTECLKNTQTHFHNNPEPALECYQGLGNNTCAMDNEESALKYTVLWLVFALQVQAWPAIHRSLRCLGDVFLHIKDNITAKSLFEVALDGATFSDIHQGLYFNMLIRMHYLLILDRADCMIRLGDIWKSKGDVEKASELWRSAQPLFKRSSQWNAVKQCNERLAALEMCSRQITEVKPGDVGGLEAEQKSLPGDVKTIKDKLGEIETEKEEESLEAQFPSVPKRIPGEDIAGSDDILV